MAGMWYENAVFYGVDIRRFQDSNNDGFGDLQGLISRLDYLSDLGIDALWLQPFLRTPLRDNGYDIMDYYQVDPRVGELDDLVALVEEARKRKIRLVMDMVMNHTSDQHPWFQAARRDPASRYRDYYSWTEKPPEHSAGGGPIFPGEEESVWTYDEMAKAYYFHRFYHFQPGLLIANPQVQEEIFEVVDFWLSLGMDGFRFDAAPIMTQAKGLEETKPDRPDLLFKELHRYITERNPDAVLLGEANVTLDKMGDFFGGDTEMNMLFNFMLGPHVMLSFGHRNAFPLRDYLKNIYMPPEKDVWLNFLRHHDELSLEKIPEEEKEFLFKKYAPKESMRIFGRGIRRRLATMLSQNGDGMDRRKVELAFSLLFSAPGTPIIYYGDEIGMGDNLSLPGRGAVRTPMQWSNEQHGGFTKAERLIAPVISEGPYGFKKVNVADQQAQDDSFLQYVKDLIAVRKRCPEIGVCPVDVMEPEGDGKYVLSSGYPSIGGSQENLSLILFHNLSEQPRSATIETGQTAGDSFDVLFGNGSVTDGKQDKMSVDLPAFGYLWVQAKKE